jgi:hypothetical protein
VKLSQLCLIACHTWDTLGAVAAGWEAALIKRGSNCLQQLRAMRYRILNTGFTLSLSFKAFSLISARALPNSPIAMTKVRGHGNCALRSTWQRCGQPKDNSNARTPFWSRYSTSSWKAWMRQI